MEKRTLFSLALAAVFMASCQQDELVSINDDASMNLGNRPELGAVTLNGGDPATRLALNTNNKYNFKWEEGDKLGAAIVDMPDLTTPVPGVDYTSKGGENYSTLEWTYAAYVKGEAKSFTTSAGKSVKVTAEEAGVDIESFYEINTGSYISSNYPYVKEGSDWTTQANLVEGNYVFYAPYNAAHLTRQPIVVTLPMEQNCTEESKAVEDFYKGTDPVTVGFSFLQAPADKSEVIYPSVAMTNLFAYPQITIKNSFNGYLFKGEAAEGGNFYSSDAAKTYTMKLNRIEIYTTTGTAPLAYKRALDADAFKDKLADGWDKTKKEDGTKIFTTGVTKDILAATGDYNVADYPAYPADQAAAKKDAGYATQYATSTTDLISDYQLQHITCDLGGKELKNGEEYKFFAIMPAEDYAKGLFAKVYVEIDGENYIILTNSTELDVVDDAKSKQNGKAYFTDATTALADYNFEDTKHGDTGVRLVRGQRYPAAEVLEDASAVKDFAGTLMTINLVGGKKQAAYAMAKVIPTDHKGIEDNADFIDHITKKVQRGVSLTEDANVETEDRDDWDADKIAFAPNNTVVINAELVKALYNRLYDKRPDGAATGNVLTLTATKLPIANDVKVAKPASGTVYTFTTLDGVSYDIDFGALVNTDGTKLENGINNVALAANTTLARKDNKVSGAVVFVSGAYEATLNSATGITGINVANDATLVVNCETDALIVSEGDITMGSKGALTKVNNVLKGTITNDNFRAIAGNTDNAVVSATMIGWPASVISATTKINALNINLGDSKDLAINKAQVEMLVNLKNVDITLGDNVSGITSSASVTLSNIKSITSNVSGGITWKTTANAITITCGDNPTTFFTKVTAGTGVTFVK